MPSGTNVRVFDAATGTVSELNAGGGSRLPQEEGPFLNTAGTAVGLHGSEQEGAEAQHNDTIAATQQGDMNAVAATEPVKSRGCIAGLVHSLRVLLACLPHDHSRPGGGGDDGGKRESAMSESGRSELVLVLDPSTGRYSSTKSDRHWFQKLGRKRKPSRPGEGVVAATAMAGWHWEPEA